MDEDHGSPWGNPSGLPGYDAPGEEAYASSLDPHCGAGHSGDHRVSNIPITPDPTLQLIVWTLLFAGVVSVGIFGVYVISHIVSGLGGG